MRMIDLSAGMSKVNALPAGLANTNIGIGMLHRPAVARF